MPHPELNYEYTIPTNNSAPNSKISPQLKEAIAELQKLQQIITAPEPVEEEQFLSLAA